MRGVPLSLFKHKSFYCTHIDELCKTSTPKIDNFVRYFKGCFHECSVKTPTLKIGTSFSTDQNLPLSAKISHFLI